MSGQKEELLSHPNPTCAVGLQENFPLSEPSDWVVSPQTSVSPVSPTSVPAWRSENPGEPDTLHFSDMEATRELKTQ